MKRHGLVIHVSVIILMCAALLLPGCQNAERWYNRALGATDPEVKIEYFTKALELDPEMAEAYLGRGKTFIEMGYNNYEDALIDYTKYLEMRPESAEGYFHRGLAFRYLGRYDHAISDISRAVDLGPESADVYYERASCFNFIGKM